MEQGSARQPWERQEGEGEVSYNHFLAFLEQDTPRNLERLSVGLGVSYGQIRNLSSEWRWADRVAAWDLEVRRREDEVTLEEVARRRRERLRQVDTLIDLAVKRLSELAKLEEKSGAPEDVIFPGAARQMLIDAIKVEQLLLGQATERVERAGGAGGEPDLDWSKYTEEQLWQLKALLAIGRPD